MTNLLLPEFIEMLRWTSFEMVLRYAHLSSDHLREAAERVTVTNLLQSPKATNNDEYATA
jgi:hypothetical protein